MGSELCLRPLCLLCCHLNIDVKIQTSVVNLSLDCDWTDSFSLTSLPPRRPWLLRSFLLPPLSSISSHPLFPIMTFAHIFPAVPDCSRVSFVCFLPLSLTSLCFPTSSLFHPSSFLLSFFEGIAMSVSELARAETFTGSTFAPPVLSPLPFVFPTFRCLCLHVKQQGVPLIRYSFWVFEDTSVSLGRCLCLQRHSECGCLP